ncbi:MAG: hypothetical protein WBE86_08680 [Candidatus Acidiferrales bacterium]
MRPAGVFLALLFVSVFAARADELHLKDGTKITGTIVGYQGNSFRVKTSYGYALVDRASVASITVSNSEAQPSTPSKTAEHKTAPAETKHGDSARPKLGAKTESSKPTSTGSVPNAANITAAAMDPNHMQEIAAPTGNSAAAVSAQKAPPAPTAAGAPAAVASVAPADSTPAPMREQVQGNLYINETYGFQIYKPPDWELIDGARAALPGSIAALGTIDHTTYLLVGLETSSDSLTAHAATTNQRLGESFDAFQPGPLRETTIAGVRAYEYHFHGVANNQSWSGTVVLLSRGENIFTIFGVTVANSDLVQIQENVIARAIASLQFTKPQ